MAAGRRYRTLMVALGPRQQRYVRALRAEDGYGRTDADVAGRLIQEGIEYFIRSGVIVRQPPPAPDAAAKGEPEVARPPRRKVRGFQSRACENPSNPSRGQP